jgi:hypothetical protein
MITAKGTKFNEWEREKEEKFSVELETLGDIYHFINYNYATIISLSFSGNIKKGSNNE